MRIANLGGRACLIDSRGRRALDLERASGGSFGPDPMQALAHWEALREAAADFDASAGEPFEPAALEACVPRPSAVYAIGLNYRDHAEEAGLEVPSSPMVFTKFPSCLAGPEAAVPLSSDSVDWEAELVVVIGREVDGVDPAHALEHVAGCCVGQDISDRRMQFKDRPPQFSLGKSLRHFGPVGPWITSLDAVGDPDDLAIHCDVAGERMQSSRTSQMVFGVAELVAYLGRYCRLLPGDLIFTGTPAGVGSVRDPRRFLAAGEVVTTSIEGLGTLRNRCVAADDAGG